MPWGWNRKKNVLFIYQSLPVLPSPSSFPCWGLSSNTCTRTHTCPWRGGGQPLAVGCCMVEQACFFLLLTARHAVARWVGPQKKTGWDVELSEEANEERGRDGGEPFEGERGQRASEGAKGRREDDLSGLFRRLTRVMWQRWFACLCVTCGSMRNTSVSPSREWDMKYWYVYKMCQIWSVCYRLDRVNLCVTDSSAWTWSPGESSAWWTQRRSASQSFTDWWVVLQPSTTHLTPLCDS